LLTDRESFCQCKKLSGYSNSWTPEKNSNPRIFHISQKLAQCSKTYQKSTEKEYSYNEVAMSPAKPSFSVFITFGSLAFLRKCKCARQPSPGASSGLNSSSTRLWKDLELADAKPKNCMSALIF